MGNEQDKDARDSPLAISPVVNDDDASLPSAARKKRRARRGEHRAVRLPRSPLFSAPPSVGSTCRGAPRSAQEEIPPGRHGLDYAGGCREARVKG